jgi:hypothetical protein
MPTGCLQRFVYILSYGASSPDLDHIKFKEYKECKSSNLEVDECYTTTDHALKYTLIHLKSRCRQKSIRGFMEFMSEKYGTIPNEIFGYEAISGNNTNKELYDHPGFKLIHQHMKEGSPEFSFWIANPDLRRGGIMKRYNRCYGKQSTTKEDSEFDVVKKRRAMGSSNRALLDSTKEDDDDTEALAAFEEFELNVLPALQIIHEDECNNQRKELEELEDKMAKGILISTTGGVYFAWSSCLNCMKIGATRRDDPSIRLRELSRHVTIPFELIGWIPTQTPFRLESLAHAHFSSARIRHAGAGTEFFSIDSVAVRAYCVAV